MDRVEVFKSELMRCCRRYCRAGVNGPRLVTLETLPWVTNKTFFGLPLRSVMSPPVPATGIETEAIFDAWLWPKFAGEGDSVEDMVTASSGTLKNWVLLGKDFNEQTLRLLYALSNAEGATLAFDKAAMMVHHGDKSYGIIDGVVHSRFCTGLKVGVDHWAWLHKRHKVNFTDEHLCSLWQEAYRRGRGAVDAVTALWQGYPDISWRALLKTRVRRDPPGQATFDKWIATLCTPGDPLPKLYPRLVPQWMTATEFNKVFCSLAVRKENPSERALQGYITRLYRFMYDSCPKPESKEDVNGNDKERESGV